MNALDDLPPFTDLHSHLVPGVDDGSRTLDEALEGIGRLVALGAGTILTTPHLDGSLTRDPQRLSARLRAFDEAFASVVEAAELRHPGLRLLRGCEIMLDRPDPDLSHPGLRGEGTAHVLVEWPGLRIPPETVPVVRAMRAQGVEVVIAHPERYAGYDAALSIVPQWREAGARLQMNHGSLVGRYGPDIRARAFRLLEAGWVDCLASDFHGRASLPLHHEEARELLEGMGAGEAWTSLALVNPERIVRGEAPLPVPPVEVDRGVLARLRARFLD